ncbi:PRKR-interacting protein 1 homolog [Harpegnathos saltator]|uniref:PRKR-interacting protein 1-like protein n=1 Tax=Harpegnathos saltator TaxID=610380 RepID=E2BP16_HARSA|nr:PRKR-interacting protein 1 homolog [Harpegnathos saltator]XP_025157838.1 PRKR-interacting protein 1 homolog [Harpegnathos saltator]EFN82608.1 PRKR-interacting protein 1-like protein [Harpegnathos saltator]
MSTSKEKDEEKPVVAKTAVDLQRLKLVKLMKNIDKPIILPERPKAKNTPSVPEFVRNVMGSSAGAGSGEFHVYRHLRRKEYARQKFIQEKAHKELLDVEYHQKLEKNKKLAEEATAKKRAKRLKKKQGRRQKKQVKTTKEDNTVASEGNSEDDSSDENEETRIAETSKEYKNNKGNIQNCLEDMSTVEDELKVTNESQEIIPKISVKVTSKNSQCENGT